MKFYLSNINTTYKLMKLVEIKSLKSISYHTLRFIITYQKKGDYKSTRKDASEIAEENYFDGYPDTGSVQENFNLISSFMQDLADKHIPSKNSLSVSLVPWITSEIRRTIHKKKKKVC